MSASYPVGGSRPTARFEALRLASSVDLNPLRVLWSFMDGLRDRLTYVRSMLITIVPFEWSISLFVVFLCLDSFGLSNEFNGAPVWLTYAAWALVPYVVFQCVRLVWQPVPFFTPHSIPRVVLPAGEYEAVCYGTFKHAYADRSFWRRRRITKTASLSFGWCRGTVELGRDQIILRTRSRTMAYRAAFEGKIEREFDITTPSTAVSGGEATVLWRRLPALKFTGPDYTIVATLRR